MGQNKEKLPLIAPSEYTNISRVIHRGPCIIKAVHISCSGANGWCVLRDGVTEQSPLKISMQTLDHTSYTWRPGDGTDFDYGIWVGVNANTTDVTVTYIPESRKAFI